MRAFVVAPGPISLRALNYLPEIERIRQSGSGSAHNLRDLVRSFGPAYGTVFTRHDCSAEHGVELLSQSDTFAAEPAGRIIRRDSMPLPERHLVERDQVLIAGAGTLGANELYGRSIIADGRLSGKYVGPDSLALTFEEPGSDISLFAYAWLASPTGVNAIRSTSYGTKILRFRAELLESLPVPMPSSDTKVKVANLIRRCMTLRDRFSSSVQAARALVGELPAMADAHAMCADRAKRALLWNGPLPTLCAWNVASTGGALGHLQASWRGKLRDVVEPNGIFRGTRFARIDCKPPFGIDLHSQRDAMLIRPVPRRIVQPDLDGGQLFAREGTILVGGQGTLGEGEIFGRATLVHGRAADVAFTEHLLRVVPRAGQEHALYAYLTTMVGFRLLRSTAVGTKLLSMREDLLSALPIPEWPANLHEQVSTLVRGAFAARLAADEAEAEAIRIVEEEVLPQWLG